MQKLIRYFNQNRKRILLIAIIIVLLIIIVRVWNYVIRTTQQAESNGTSNTYTIRDTSVPDEFIISGEEISEEDGENDKNIVNNFIDFCNTKNYTEAYNMLTSDCQNAVFGGDINNFIEKYCNIIFETPKTFQLEGWIDKNSRITYRITYIEDNILATGGISEELKYTDYITLANENEETKLSIYNFIRSDELSKEENEENIIISVTNSQTYMDYVTYTITVINNRDKTILLSDNSDNKQICLVDNDYIEYISYLNEIPRFNLIINPGEQKQLNIRFNKVYSSDNRTELIRFKNVYLDYEAYSNNPDDTNLQKMQIEIDL